MNIKLVGTIAQTLRLLLPALIPSWRFFDVIAPSPRIEFTLLETAHDIPTAWQEFRPRPAELSAREMLKRLFWNPRWNESLFLVSCAERLMANPTEHSSAEIFTRIGAELNQNPTDVKLPPYLQFRLVFLDRQNAEIHKRTTYTSPVQRYSEITSS
ncbi:MAG: hypothetical protein JKY12_05050 [Sneathiella sp.]|nr:hypothetical protein [Sneathiella sp.]